MVIDSNRNNHGKVLLIVGGVTWCDYSSRCNSMDYVLLPNPSFKSIENKSVGQSSGFSSKFILY